MRDLPALSWLNRKMFKNSAGSRKNRSGHKEEHIEASVINNMYNLHAEAEVEDASRSFARAVDKAFQEIDADRCPVVVID